MRAIAIAVLLETVAKRVRKNAKYDILDYIIKHVN